MKKILILVASPPACGKTFVSELIAESVEHLVYLDKDDLADLICASFAATDNVVDMDGDFYNNNLRGAEYSSIMNIAFSALRFEQLVLLNAPFGKEVRDVEYMRAVKEKANQYGAQLMLIWVKATPEICYKRMKERNSYRDRLKLENWESYVKKLNFTPPYELMDNGVVDHFVVFDTNTDALRTQSLEETINIIKGE